MSEPQNTNQPIRSSTDMLVDEDHTPKESGVSTAKDNPHKEDDDVPTNKDITHDETALEDYCVSATKPGASNNSRAVSATAETTVPGTDPDNAGNDVALPVKTRRKSRTPAQKAYDEAVEAQKKAADAVALALINLQATQREAKYQAGVKMMHLMLLKANKSVRDGVLSMVLGMADDDAQPVLQDYLSALNSAPLS